MLMKVCGYHRAVCLAFINLPALICSFPLHAQETNSHISGLIQSANNELLAGATVTLVHEPTKNTYSTQANGSGYYYFFNLKPGGPYTITASCAGYHTETKQDLYFNYSSLQDEDFIPFVMKKQDILLEEVVVAGKRSGDAKIGTETNITEQQIRSLPSISRNLQDYIRLVPQAKVSGDGMMSLAGQPNKYNAVFIDGSNSNDLLGLAQSGTNVGQTESSPLSPEAIEEIKVSPAPYNAQYGNFTGGSINIITRSGTNQFKSSAWYFFRNEQMTGRSPIPVEKAGSPGVFERPRLSRFFNQTAGVWASGPVIQNKLFYFLLPDTLQGSVSIHNVTIYYVYTNNPVRH